MQKNSLHTLIEKINSYAKKVLKESRYQHSVRVAKYAAHLAELHNRKMQNTEAVSPELAYVTGLAHDICKNESDAMLLKTVEKDGFGIDDIEKEKPNLLHGRAAAIILKNEFGVTDNSVLNAVAFHTFGYESIDVLGKIIYIADKIEPERPDTEEFRIFAETASLDHLMIKVLDWRNDYILKKGGKVHPFTKKMYDQIRKDVNI